MGQFSDLARSLVRAGIDRARERGRVPDRVRSVLREITSQGTDITEQELGAALSATTGVTALSVTARRGTLQVHAQFDDYAPLGGLLSLDAIRFAPRGAKELVFRWVPSETAKHPMVRPLVGTLASIIAHSLWSVVLGPSANDGSSAIVDRDGPGTFLVDLRSVPAAREALRKGAPGLVIDTLSLADITMTDGRLRLRFRFPSLVG